VNETSDALQQGTISGILKRETKLTFYTRFGWLVPWAVLALAIGAWLMVSLPSRATKRIFQACRINA